MQTHEVKCPSGVIVLVEIDRDNPDSIRVNVTNFKSMVDGDRGFMLMWCAKMLPLADPTVQIILTKDGIDPLVMMPFPVTVDELIEENSHECVCELCIQDRKMAEKAKFN